MEDPSIEIKKSHTHGKWNGLLIDFTGPVCLLGLSELHHLAMVGWLDALQGRSVAHVTSSYWGDVDNGQMCERGLEGVYGIVTKGKQFREFKFHLRGRKNVETVVGRLPKAWAPNCFH